MAQEGFLYEENAYKALKKFNISTGVVAGASHTLPDLTIHKPSKIVAKKLSGYQTAGVELKNQPTAAGSLVMKYYKGAWDYGKYNDAEEKIFIHDLAESQALLKNMNTYLIFFIIGVPVASNNLIFFADINLSYIIFAFFDPLIMALNNKCASSIKINVPVKSILDKSSPARAEFIVI